MAQEQPERNVDEILSSEVARSGSGGLQIPFRLNAEAPAFVPRAQPVQFQPSGFLYPCVGHADASNKSESFHAGPQPLRSDSGLNKIPILNDALKQKIIKQVEYQFSDMSLLANEAMSKHTSKDPEGFVPIQVIASTKKMKALVCDDNLISQALRSSSKLVLSEDGKRVRRDVPFTDRDREDLQSRTVVAENLPEDYSHQNLEKIFSVAGSVKTIRVCHPQDSASRIKNDFPICHKLHALVEFETPQIAETAVEKLNDERNWRKGLRVRLLVRCSPRSVLKIKKYDFEGVLEDDEASPTDSVEDVPSLKNSDFAPGCHGGENLVSPAKGKLCGNSKTNQGYLRRVPVASPVQPMTPRSVSLRGPRMPDGTRGFTTGRGKPMEPSSPGSCVDP